MTTAVRQARRRSHAPDGAAQHRGWLELIEISGPFLSLPVLRQAWPTLDALEKPTRDALRREHTAWRDDPDGRSGEWIQWVLTGLLGWGDELREGPDDLEAVGLDVPEHETRVVPSFALVEPGEDVKPATTRLLGLVCPPGHSPTARVPGSPWAATYADRLAAVCRHHGVELGLASDGRWWALVWAPKDKATGVAVFDTIAWPELAERDVVRAFSSILCRSRFFGVPDDERLPALLHDSLGSQEDITEALGSQVREAVELLVAALGRQDLLARERGLPDLANVEAHEVYRGAVSVMMRIVFLLFAEERRLLPADNDLYASTYSAGQLCAELEQRALDGSEDDLEHTSVAWHRLLALFAAVHGGVDHPRLTMHAHDGSLFDPDTYVWLDMPIDDRTVLHMLRAVQYVEIGSGRSKERRSLSFRSLGVEEIGYVYEGLLAYDAFRAVDVVVGLAGKRGSEPEVELRELERIASFHTDLTALGGELSGRFKDSGLGNARSIANKMKPLAGVAAEDARRKVLAAAQGDVRLADRLMPFAGILRQDLRELPMVIAPGALYVTDSPRRRNTGTHYTPRELAEEVVLHALEPLVYEPGPLQTADTSEWKLKTADEILALNVADIAMGSAAFLVAAARYLGARLIEAWTRAGDERAQAYAISDVKSDEDPVVIDGRRQIIEHCLYGVDINPMAVEMGKLSLWLVSMDPVRPFTFLDDRLVEGDSLLGISSIDQLEHMKLGGERPEYEDPDLLGWEKQTRELVEESASERLAISTLPDNAGLLGIDRKRALLVEAWANLERLRIASDLLVGSALRSAQKYDSAANRSVSPEAGSHSDTLARAKELIASLIAGTTERSARETARLWLRTDTTESRFNCEPLHWPLKFPEVVDRAGFDAVVGNPPFLGGSKVSGAYGIAYRAFLVDNVANGVRGNADLVAYFFLRAATLVRPRGQLGLVATSSLAEGDTREVGLDQIERKCAIRRATKSAPWPAKNSLLNYSSIWIYNDAQLPPTATAILDGKPVQEITSSLGAASRANGRPSRLRSNSGVAFQASKIDGVGFTLTREQALEALGRDSSYGDVIFPFLSGQDLNSTSDAAASRWVVNFFDWDEERARKYPVAYEKVLRDVKPERDKNNRKARRERWWQYGESAKGLYQSIDSLDHVIAVTLHTKPLAPMIVPTGQVYSHALGIFARSDTETLAILSSSIHYWWARAWGSTLGDGIRYTPSDVYETFPFAHASCSELTRLGGELNLLRLETMADRDIGLTATYNLVYEPSCMDTDVERIRYVHRAIDFAVLQTYGWQGRVGAIGGLDHGFHRVGREIRYTIGPIAQREILDSLLELNHERYAEEVAQGLHDRKKGGRAKKTAEQEGMFDAE